MTQAMAAYLNQNLDIIYFFYGLSFILLGMSIFLQLRTTIKSEFKLINILWLLGGFGLSHGTHEMFDLFTLLKGKPPALEIGSYLISLLSYVLLFAFGYRLINIGERKRVNLLLPAVCLASFIVVPLTFGLGDFAVWKVVAKYFVGFPGGVLTAVGLIFYCQEICPQLNAVSIRKYFFAASFFFMSYAVLSGLIVPRAGFLPAAIFNQEQFNILTGGIPIQFFRMISALGMTWTVWQIINIFNIEALQHQENLLHQYKVISEAAIGRELKLMELEKEIEKLKKGMGPA
jgi:hypothetical protein